MRKKKVLIVEDECELVYMIKKYLIREQFEVAIVLNGGDALATFNSFQPDMVLLDVMLPEKDGLEILRQIRITSTVPVIIISAKETELDRILGLKIGADDYLTKPFSIKELVVRVETIFRRIDTYSIKSVQKQVLEYNRFKIDLNSREIDIDNTLLNFTAKEFDLFIFLLQHPKQVFSKTHLYDSVWGINEYGDINTVTIHVQKIREKLGKEHAITTIRGIGYRFDGVLM